MNKEIKKLIRDLESKNIQYAKGMSELLFKLEILKAKLPNHAMPRDADHRARMLASVRLIESSSFARALSERNKGRIERIKKWRMIVP